MLSRSRSLFTLLTMLALVMMVFSGCKSTKAKAERRLAFDPDSARAGQNNQAGLNGMTGTDPYGWSPTGGAPGDGGLNGTGTMTAGTRSDFAPVFDPATNSLANTANTSGVEDGTFVSELQMVHFEYDSSEITPDWQRILDEHAAWITQHGSAMVQIEGHCDERGTEEYNVSLGQRRADTIRNYLVSAGVDPNRLSTISYGKMRPLSFDTNEEAHRLNRRAMFLVYEVQTDSVASAGTY